METRSVLTLPYAWQDDVIWPVSALVKHGKDIYRAQSETNAAEPGNHTYGRFYVSFLLKKNCVFFSFVVFMC